MSGWNGTHAPRRSSSAALPRSSACCSSPRCRSRCWLLDARFRYAEGLRSVARARASTRCSASPRAPAALARAHRRVLRHASRSCARRTPSCARRLLDASQRGAALRGAAGRDRAAARADRRRRAPRRQGARRPRCSTPAATRSRARSSSTRARSTACSAGQPVIDERGVVGQVTRVYPWLAEVTLITDKDQAIPVQVLRNGLRAVPSAPAPTACSSCASWPLNADIQNGDRLVTSGIDGTYPPGLPVAQVAQRRARRRATPSRASSASRAAGVERGRYVLVLANVDARRSCPRTAAPRREAPGKTRKPREGRTDAAAVTRITLAARSCCRCSASTIVALVRARAARSTSCRGRTCALVPGFRRAGAASSGACASRASSASARPGCSACSWTSATACCSASTRSPTRCSPSPASCCRAASCGSRSGAQALHVVALLLFAQGVTLAGAPRSPAPSFPGWTLLRRPLVGARAVAARRACCCCAAAPRADPRPD